MGRPSWRPAALLVLGLMCAALVVGRAAPSIGSAPHAEQHEQPSGSAIADVVSIPAAQVGSLLVLRRDTPDGGATSPIANLAAIAAACAMALVGARRARSDAASARTARWVRVAGGVRAPPAARA